MKKILIMNGPNLNLLGEREPNIYGNETLNTINDDLDEKARKLGYEPVFFQSQFRGRSSSTACTNPAWTAPELSSTLAHTRTTATLSATLSRRYAFR